MKFSAIFKPIALFSLKDSNATNSGSKSLFLPSPYAIKMALLNQAITLDGVDFNTVINKFTIVRDARIAYRIRGNFCVNNCFVKLQKQRSKESFKATVSFREYIYITDPIEIIFDVPDKQAVEFWKHYLYRINYFGKRGCFFQFINYNDNPPEANVDKFLSENYRSGIIQEYDDFGQDVSFDMVNNYDKESKTKRQKILYLLPLKRCSASKSYTNYRVKSDFIPGGELKDIIV